jgi:L-iditol 2-dehydrogenase
MTTSTGKMKAAVWYGPRDLRVEERPIPEVVDGSVLVAIKACAICGSDLRIYNEGNARIREPRIIGHEIAGEIVAVGRGVERFQVGNRISVGADVPCGKCAHCLAGRANCCDTNLAIGHQFDGGFAEYICLDPIVVELGPVRSFTTDIPYEMAALAEPLACCINGFELAMMRPGNSVVIFGTGPIGIMLSLLARHYEASQVILIEPSETRRELARKFGPATLIDPTQTDVVQAVMDLTGGLGADTIFTACPAVETHIQALAMVAKRGVVNFFGGLPKSAPPIQLLSNHVHYRESYITGSHGSVPRQHAMALDMIESGRVDMKQIITDIIGLDEIISGIAKARAGDAMKVVIAPAL